MRLLRVSIFFIASLILLSAAPSFAATALVWASGNDGGNTAGVAAYLADGGCYGPVESTDADFVPLATLLSYDAVFFFSNHSNSQDPVQIGNVLADYADTGRRLVLCTFSWASQGSNTLGGRIITDQLSPLITAGTTAYSAVTMPSNDGSGYFTGVATLSGFYHDRVALAAGATLHSTWSDGELLLADKNNVVAVNLFPDDSWGSIGGDYRRLFQNALCWTDAPVAVQASAWSNVKSRYR